MLPLIAILVYRVLKFQLMYTSLNWENFPPENEDFEVQKYESCFWLRDTHNTE